MKKLLPLTLLSTILLSSFSLMAVHPKSPVSADEEIHTIEKEFQDLSNLEKVVLESGKTYEELAVENEPLLKETSVIENIGNALYAAMSPDEKALGIPGFLWGFCFGLLGVVLVYVVIEDDEAKKREGKNALIGCAVSSLVYVLVYVLAIAASTV